MELPTARKTSIQPRPPGRIVWIVSLLAGPCGIDAHMRACQTPPNIEHSLTLGGWRSLQKPRVPTRSLWGFREQAELCGWPLLLCGWPLLLRPGWGLPLSGAGFAGFADAGRADRLAAAKTAGQAEGFFSEFFVTYPPSAGLIKERAGELTLFLSLQCTYLTPRC